MADLTHLDSNALKAFMDNDLTDFQNELDKIRQSDPSGVPSMNDILHMISADTLGESQVLGIGKMGQDDTVAGKTLISKVSDNGKTIDDTFVSQKTLFGDIHKDMQDTIDKLLSKQGDSLASVDSEKMLDAFSDVDGDMSPSSGAGGGGSGSTGGTGGSGGSGGSTS